MDDLTPRDAAGLRAAAVALGAAATQLHDEQRTPLTATLTAAAAQLHAAADGHGDRDALQLLLHDVHAQLDASVAPGAAVWTVQARRRIDDAQQTVTRTLDRLAS